MAEAGIEGDFKCGICLSMYTEPRLLDCYHIFCTPCLEKLGSDTEDIVCPLCRTKIILPHEGVGGLKLYPFFVSQKLRNDHTDYCALCFEENIAVVNCMDCKVNLCSECRDYHKRLKSSKNHNLMELGSNLKICGLTSSGNSNEIGECREHKKELILFCKPCNKVICIDCNENVHVKHEVESLMRSARIKRDILLRRNASLKSKIPLLDNYIESVKTEEANYYKNTNQMKREIKSHATCLKEMLCKTVDILTMESIDFVERNCKTNTKIIQVYTDELEVEKMAVSLLQKTTEMLINKHSDAKILQKYFVLSRRLDKALKDTGKCFPALESLKFKQGIFGQEKVKELFGQVIKLLIYECPKLTLSCLNVPELDAKPRMITSFTKPGQLLGMVSSNDDNVWISTHDETSLHSLDGTVKSSFCPPDKSTKVLQKSGTKEIWFWCGQSAKKGNTEEEYYKVEAEGWIGCCFLDNGNLIVYNPVNKSLNEISENGINQRTISNPKLQEYKSEKNVTIAETKICKNLVISEGLDTVLIADHNGHVKNTFQKPRAQFTPITTDNYGNILVVDYQNDLLTLLSEEGVFLCDLLSKKDGGIYGIDHMTIDECGNLWLADSLTDSPTTVKIFSYL